MDYKQWLRAEVKPGAFSGEVDYSFVCHNKATGESETFYLGCPTHYVDMERQLVEASVVEYDKDTDLYTVMLPYIQQHVYAYVKLEQLLEE